MLSRKEMAAKILAGLCANPALLQVSSLPGSAHTFPSLAVQMADGLLYALKQPAKFKPPEQKTQPDVTKNSEG